MSKSGAKAFRELLKTRLDLQNKLQEAGSVETLIKIAAGQGYTFTKEEWETAIQAELEENSPEKNPGTLTLEEKPALPESEPPLKGDS